MNSARMWLTLAVAMSVWSGSASALPADDLPGLKRGDTVPTQMLRTTEGEQAGVLTADASAVVLLYLTAEQRASESAAVDARRAVSSAAKAGARARLVYVTGDSTLKPYFTRLRQQQGLEDVMLLIDPGRELAGKLGSAETPITLILDDRGRLIHAQVGYDAGYMRGLEARLAHTLGKLDEAGLKQVLNNEHATDATPEVRSASCRASARHLRERGLLDEARAELDKAAALTPGSGEVALDIADLELSRERNDPAEAALNTLRAPDTDSRRAKLLWGIMHLRRGRLDEAERSLTAALELNPDPARAHYYLARVFELKHQTDEALKHYRAAAERALGEPAAAR